MMRNQSRFPLYLAGLFAAAAIGLATSGHSSSLQRKTVPGPEEEQAVTAEPVRLRTPEMPDDPSDLWEPLKGNNPELALAVPDLSKVPPLTVGNALEILASLHPDPVTELALADSRSGALRIVPSPTYRFSQFATEADQDGTVVPVMRIFEEPELTMCNEGDFLANMAQLLHEATRYQQWKHRTLDATVVRLAGADAPWARGNGCADLWVAWHDATHHECAAATRWGVRENPACASIPGSAPFKQALFFTLMDPYMEAPLDACAYTWARLAGHPRPETYE